MNKQQILELMESKGVKSITFKREISRTSRNLKFLWFITFGDEETAYTAHPSTVRAFANMEGGKKVFLDEVKYTKNN